MTGTVIGTVSKTVSKITIAVLLALALALPALAAGKSAHADGKSVAKNIYGYLEDVIVLDVGFEIPAKLDTGADTSSLDATKIKRFRRGDKSWVRFSVENPESGEIVTLEKHFVRSARIKRHDGEHQRRPVVDIEICLGGERRKVEVSLIDRSHFEYPVLLGRSALEGLALVDPELTFTSKPICDGEEDG